MNPLFKTVWYRGFKIDVPHDLILYHGTSIENHNNIMVMGLDPKFSGFSEQLIWLETDYNTAVLWGGGTQQAVVYAIRVKDLDPRGLEIDSYNYEYFDDIIAEYNDLTLEDVTFTYDRVIEPENLYLVELKS